MLRRARDHVHHAGHTVPHRSAAALDEAADVLGLPEVLRRVVEHRDEPDRRP